MKILIFGIDGLGKESLEYLGLSKLSQRIHAGRVGNPAISNVISRGWPELYAGKEAFQSGCFYQIPEYRKGKITSSQNTGLSRLKKIIGSENLIWNVLGEMGYKVGLFSIPTVSRPETVNGFCVAATGAGKINNSMGSEDVYPADLFCGIDLDGVDLGLRMGYGAYIPSGITDLEVKASKHIDDYFQLLREAAVRKPVDVCFAVTRFVNEMAYKFLTLCKKEAVNDYEKKLKQSILRLCARFDDKLDDFFDYIKPDHLFIVSDHGIGEFEKELNLNQLLVELGEMKRRSLFSHWKEIARPAYKYFLRNVLLRKVPVDTPKYDLEGGEFFSIGFTNLYYLNNHRFGKGYLSKSQCFEKSKMMAARMNSWSQEMGYKKFLKFKPLDSDEYVGNGPDKVALPNIICVMSTGLANTERVGQVLSNKSISFSTMFADGFYGEYSGCKTEDTIASYSGKYSSEVDFTNLISIYRSILNIAAREK